MWLITKRGFVSAVEWQRPGDAHHGMIVLRARERAHLVAVLGVLYETKARAAGEVKESPQADYRFRAWITHEQFEELVVRLAREVKYPNFKNEVMRFEGKAKASRYESALHSVWTTLGRLQPGGPYGRGDGSWTGKAPKSKTKTSKKTKAVVPEVAVEGGCVCAECGREGPAREFETLLGDTLCKDVNGCLTRMDAQGRLPVF